MAEGRDHVHDSESAAAEIKDTGLFDFLGRPREDELVIVSGFDKAGEAGDKYYSDSEEKSPGPLEKLRRSDSSSSSSSCDEGEDDQKKEKKKKKKEKGLREKIKDKISDEEEEDDTEVPIERLDDNADEKKGFLEKIKGKLPGGHPKKADQDSSLECCDTKGHEGETVKEKKGILEKIKEKLPGYNRNGGEGDADH